MLLFAGIYLVELVCELMFGDLNNAAIPEGSPDNILMITKIILFVVSLVLLLPQIYIGVKGMRIAKNPNSSKGHIIWAIILLVIAVLNLIDPIVGLINNGGVYDNLTTLSSVVLEIAIYYDYIKYAGAVAKAV